MNAKKKKELTKHNIELSEFMIKLEDKYNLKESEIELLEYELKIALLNNRFQDAEDIKSDIIELENEVMSMGY